MHKRVITAKTAQSMAGKRARRLARTFIEYPNPVRVEIVKFLEDVEILTKRTERHLPLYSDLLKEFIYRTPKKSEVESIELLFKKYAREMKEQEFDVSYELEVT